MVRTQISLTEQQAERLRSLATARRQSMAELVRDAVDRLIAESTSNEAERRRRALSAVGRFASGHSDVSRKHDQHLAEAWSR